MKIDDEYFATHQRRGCIFIIITALARICGIITLAGLILTTYMEWIAADYWNFRIYVTIATVIVAYLELLWILDKCITCCICCFRSEACFYWTCCIPIDNWLKTIIYIGLSLPFFIPTWLSIVVRTDIKVAGALLIFTGLIYFLKSFKYKRIDMDDLHEENQLVSEINSMPLPSISTQTSIIGINNDSLSCTFPVEQEANK